MYPAAKYLWKVPRKGPKIEAPTKRNICLCRIPRDTTAHLAVIDARSLAIPETGWTNSEERCKCRHFLSFFRQVAQKTSAPSPGPQQTDCETTVSIYAGTSSQFSRVYAMEGKGADGNLTPVKHYCRGNCLGYRIRSIPSGILPALNPQ